MLLPQTAEYALRATIRIAEHQHAAPPPSAGAWVRVGDIAAAVGVPRNYLSKTLHQLVRAGVLVSSRGPAGGFRLAVPAAELTLARVAGVFAQPNGAAYGAPYGPAPAHRCLLGSGPCGSVPGCPVHERWRPVATRVAAFFGTTTIADVIGDAIVDAGQERARADVPLPPSPPRRAARQESIP
jgi:Rrf2 family iron-sulfur cluster assembly transcriptional regulator